MMTRKIKNQTGHTSMRLLVLYFRVVLAGTGDGRGLSVSAVSHQRVSVANIIARQIIAAFQ